MGRQRIAAVQVLGDLRGEQFGETAAAVNRRQFGLLGLRVVIEARRSLAMSASSESRCVETDPYSPAAIENAPAAIAATPVSTIVEREAFPAATPVSRAAVDSSPSLAPSTAARSQPLRWLRWFSSEAR